MVSQILNLEIQFSIFLLKPGQNKKGQKNGAARIFFLALLILWRLYLKYGYFFKNEPLISCPFLASKLDSPVIKKLERHSLNVKNPYFSSGKKFIGCQNNLYG